MLPLDIGRNHDRIMPFRELPLSKTSSKPDYDAAKLARREARLKRTADSVHAKEKTPVH